MRALVQRVTRACVQVDGETVGEIGTGLVILVGAANADTVEHSVALARKVAGLRILRDEVSLLDVPTASALVISQFTLYADTRKGRRPSWSAAAPGDVAEPLVDAFSHALGDLGVWVATGRFGADMSVELVNDGPVTLLLEV